MKSMATQTPKGNVRKIIKFSAVDGPGNRSAIFLQGCNFNCIYCHNPETIPRHSDDVQVMTGLAVFQELGSALNFVRGITVSGGECTLQPDFLLSLFQMAKEKGLDTFIDSNGSYDFSRNPELLALTDGVMLDVKSMDEAEHKKITGVGNGMVLKNLDFLAERHKLFEIRTVCSPDMLDCERTIGEAARRIAPYGDIRYKLIQFRKNGVREEHRHYKAPSTKVMESYKAVALTHGVRDIVII